jgi:hypothetical protein
LRRLWQTRKPRICGDKHSEDRGMSEKIERVAKAIIGTMFVEHELPLEDEIYQKYLVTASAAMSMLAALQKMQASFFSAYC